MNEHLNTGFVNIALTAFGVAAILLDLERTARVFAIIGVIAVIGWLVLTVVSAYVEATY